MDRTRLGSLGVGVVGVLATQFAAAPGETTFGAGPMEIDPYYVFLGGFCFFILWGLWALLAKNPARRGA
jgi:hypothetical protein